MTKKYTVIIERDEDGWLISDVLELPGCHTQAKTMAELIERTKEAIRAYVGDNAEEHSTEFVGVQHITV